MRKRSAKYYICSKYKIVIGKGTDFLPVIPHKAVAEVSKQEIYRKNYLKPLMVQQVLEFALFYLFPFLYIFLIIYLPIYWSISLPIYLSFSLSRPLSIHLSTYLSSCLGF